MLKFTSKYNFLWLTICFLPIFLILVTTSTTKIYAAFINASGYVGMLGVSHYYPNAGISNNRVQGVEKFARVNVEIRPGDIMYLHLGLGFWPSTESHFFGGEVTDSYQPAFNQHYDDFSPKVSEFYVNYATRYCLFSAGRKSRHVGMGIFLNSGEGFFQAPGSTFDGVSCKINTSGGWRAFSVTLGLDKIKEGDLLTSGDDSQQFYAHAQYNDLDASSSELNSGLKKKVELYFAWVSSVNDHKAGVNKQRLVDFSTGLYWGPVSWEFEGLLRMGKASGDSWVKQGARPKKSAEAEINSLAFASEFSVSFPPQFALAQTHTNTKDSLDQLEEFSQSLPDQQNDPELTDETTDSQPSNNLSPILSQSTPSHRHEVIVGYIYSPGDSDGYFKGSDPSLTSSQRDAKLTALPLNRNYKPGLILFNTYNNHLDIDGVYNGDYIVNAHVLTLEYRFIHLKHGLLSSKIIAARMVEQIAGTVLNYFQYNDIRSTSSAYPEGYYKFIDNQYYPIGNKGENLGVELNLSYTYDINELVQIHIASGVLFPGAAFDVFSKKAQNRTGNNKTTTNTKPKNVYAIEFGLAAKL